MRPRDERIEVSCGTEDRINAAIVRNVVAEVAHRRGEEWREPDAVDTQAAHIIELLRNSGKVADAITVGVREAARINLVDYRAAPPGQLRRGADFRARLINEHRTPHNLKREG